MVNSLSEQVQWKMGLALTGDWSEAPLAIVMQACEDFCQAFHLNPPLHQGWLKHLQVCLQPLVYGGLTSFRRIRLNPLGLTTWTVLHELGHAWDYASLCTFSWRMMVATGSAGPVPILHRVEPMQKRYWYRVGNPPPPCGIDQNFNRYEDFAEAVAAYVYPKEAFQRAIASGYPYGHYGYIHFHQTPRGKFVETLAEALQRNEMALTL